MSNFVERLHELCQTPEPVEPSVAAWALRFFETKPESVTQHNFAVWLSNNVLNKVSRRSQYVYLSRIKRVFPDDEALMILVKTNLKCSPNASNNEKKKKAKSINWDKFAALEHHLEGKGQSWHIETIEWLRAQILTGLRPKEWQSAKIYSTRDNKPVLKVRNTVKASRAPTGEDYKLPPFRIIPLHLLDKQDLLTIRKHLSLAQIKTVTGEFENWYNQIRQQLYRASLACFPNEPAINLYSGRNQFAANIKGNLSKSSTKLLMGHGNEKRARQDYGAKRHGEPIAITNEEVSALYDEFANSGRAELEER
ncbi:hypothetical protein [Shewanella colwelliana]|uniref:hypothetical protein n=1 Tax=Shewanella colwelliana TaxID=23 RepID=UPI0022B06467|nr:hypothetical protein [Shewanella colwelliana]MCZ4337769.1 hypothetical protein [Shewanella colwelliana]